MPRFEDIKSRLLKILIRRRFIYLFLAAMCFLTALMTYFIDGYLGIYDTLSVSIDGKIDQVVETYQWLRRDGSWVGSAPWGKTVYFSYKIENHEFSEYGAIIEVSLWHDGEELGKLASQSLAIAVFRAGKVNWSIDTLDLEPAPPSSSTPYTYSIFIGSDRIHRELIFYITEPLKQKETEVIIRSRREAPLGAPGSLRK